MVVGKNLSLPYHERAWLKFEKEVEGEGDKGAKEGKGPPSTSGGGGAPPSEGLSKDEAKALRDELAKEKSTNKDLQDVWEDMQKALKQDTDPETREASVRRVLKRAGYSEKEVREYLNPGGEEEAPRRNGKKEAREEEVEGEDLSKEALRDARQARVEVLQDRLEKAMDRTFDEKSDLGKLLAGVTEAKGEKAGKAFGEAVREEVEELATKLMHERRKKEKRFEAGWVAEEVKKAAERVEKKYRPVIADLNKVGRSPETDAGEVLLKSEPVKAPKFPKSGEKGPSVSQGKTQLQEFTNDALLRLAAAASTGKTRA